MSDLCTHCSDRGMCCRYVELPLARALTPDEINWIELHQGLKLLDPQTIHIEINCSALTEEGLCGLYGTDARPQMCDIWPDDPKNQAPVGCAFLERVN